jgi:phage shock protein A
MKPTTGPRIAILVLLAASAAGCSDKSKPELERTKQQLAQVTTERDNLKSQVDQQEAKLTELEKKMTALQATTSSNAAAAGKAHPTATKAAGKHATHAKGTKKKKRR